MNRRTYFDNIAENWDEKFCTPELITFLKRLVPVFGLKLGQRILDVGTGTGVLIPFLSEAVGPTGLIIAIDYAEKMVKVCRSKHSHIRNFTIKLQDVEELEIPSESFDAITCFGLFPHLDDKTKALNNMYNTLRPGGKLIIAHALSSNEIKDHHKKASPALIHDSLPERSEMRRLLEDSGFVDVKIEDKPGCYLCLSIKSQG